MRRLAEGELSELSALDSAGAEEIKAWADTLAQPLTVGRTAVSRVLRLMLAGDVSPEAVQSWASMMRWGAMRRPSGLIAVEVDYERSFEDKIIDVLARLDEIGDLVDGEISADEGKGMLRLMSE